MIPSRERNTFVKKRSGLVTMRGNSVTLVGEEAKVGEPAPDFVVIGTDMKPVQFSSFRGKVCVIYSVPSLDTPVCDRTTRRFNEEATRLGSDVAVLAISMDLPFAQARWCAAADIKGVQTFSDHRDASFGTSYGVLIEEMRLLARAVFVVDSRGTIRHAQIIKEIAEEPDFDAALKAVKERV